MALSRPRMTRLVPLAVALLPLASLTAQEPNFGTAAAVAGREVFIGQPANQYATGFVYQFKPDARGAWREAARLAGPDSTRFNGFGRRIAVDGNTLLVSESPSDSSAPGRVHVYERASAAAAWRYVTTLNPQGAVNGDRVGRTLALVGDVAAVGATRSDSMLGAVFIFRRSNGAWTQEAKLRPVGIKPATGFGAALSLQKDLILVGALQADSNAGAAYVFRRDADGSWKQEGGALQLPIGGGQGAPAAQRANAQFGAAVLLHEGAAYIGAPGFAQGQGRVARFTYDTAQKRWNQGGSLFPFVSTPNTQFGGALASAGKDVVVGAQGANQFRGAVFRFTLDTAGVATAVTRMVYDSTKIQGGFGGTLAAGADFLVAGMGQADFAEGRAVIVAKGPAGRLTQTTLRGQVFRPAAIAGTEAQCTDGKVGEFDCRQTNLLALVPTAEMGGGTARLNTVWGWTDPETGKEYAIVGRADGTSFLDVSNPTRPRYLGNLPKTEAAPATVWREFKVMGNWVYIVSDGAPKHGMQVFDLTRLRSVRTPQLFTPDVTYDRVSAAHNVATNPATNTVFITGANAGGETCGGGLHMVDAKDPRSPVFLGCFQDMGTGFAGTGYSHDVQCVMYHGPDTRYSGHEICFGGNETHLSIGDVTDKSKPVAVGRASYPDFGYIHQGWLTEDHKYFYVNDELDEVQGKATKGTRTIIFDVSKLDDPVVVGEYIGETKATDHNLYIRGDRMYESNYQAGLRVIDISDRLNPKEVGFFDVVPVGDNGPGFGGTWNNYPYFKSGTILVSSAYEGLFLLRDQSAPMTP